MVAATIRMNKKKNIIREITQQNRAISCVFYRSDSTGKERDEETGYGYFGARYLDHDLMTMWLSVDPLADKYPTLSPYNYCAWNPVKLVDPDGRDVWKVTEDGSVQRTSDEGGNRKQTVIYANGNTATFKGSKYHNVMSDLSVTSAEGVSSSYGGENMQTAYANVFKSMADNTNVEWIMQRYSDNHYALGTKHHQTKSPKSSALSKANHCDKDVVALIHSHPMASGHENPTSIKSQISSMGYEDDPRFGHGDVALKYLNFSGANYYTYFPKTKQLWGVCLPRPVFIRSINSVSDFFFGTYNTK